MGDGVFITTGEGQIVETDERCAVLLGDYGGNSIVHASLLDLADAVDRVALRAVIADVRLGYPATLEFAVAGPDGASRRLSVLAMLDEITPSHSSSRIVWIAREVVSLAPDSVVAAEDRGGDMELDSCPRALDEDRVELEILRRAISHDLRTPLGAIRGFAHILTQRSAGLDPSGQRCVKNIAEASARVQRMIEDLAEYTALSTRKLRPQSIDMNALLAPIVRGCLAKKVHAADRFEVSAELPMAFADPGLVSLAFTELLENALHYRKPGSPVHVEVSGEQVDSRTVIQVRDDGIGIPPEYRDQVLRAFQRLHAQDEFPGIGMGLTLAVRALSLSRGSLTIEGSVPSGCTMRVELPHRAPRIAVS